MSNLLKTRVIIWLELRMHYAQYNQYNAQGSCSNKGENMLKYLENWLAESRQSKITSNLKYPRKGKSTYLRIYEANKSNKINPTLEHGCINLMKHLPVNFLFARKCNKAAKKRNVKETGLDEWKKVSLIARHVVNTRI